MHNKVPKNEYLNKKGYAPKKNPEKIVNEGVIYDPRGQWAFPGEVTKIPSGDITMQGVSYPVLGVDDLGNEQMMYPGFDYTFPGNTVTEYPQLQYGGDPSIPDLTQAKKGGWLNKYSKMPKKKSSKNIKSSINKLMTRNPLFDRNYMLYGAKGPRLYDPKSKYQTGGVTINSEEEYQKSLLMKNKTKERIDAERAWAAKKVAAANQAKTQQPSGIPLPQGNQPYTYNWSAADIRSKPGPVATPQVVMTSTSLPQHDYIREAKVNKAMAEAKEKKDAADLQVQKDLYGNTLGTLRYYANKTEEWAEGDEGSKYYYKDPDTGQMRSFSEVGAYEQVGVPLQDAAYGSFPLFEGAAFIASPIKKGLSKAIAPSVEYLTSKTPFKGFKFTPDQLPGSPNNLIPQTPPNPNLGNPLGTADDIKRSLMQEDQYLFPSEYKTRGIPFSSFKPSAGGYTDIPQFNQEIQNFNTLMQFGKRPLETQIIARPETQNLLGQKAFIESTGDYPMHFNMYGTSYEMVPGLNLKRTKPFTGYQMFQQIQPNKYGGSSRKSPKKLVNYSQKPNFVKTQSNSWLDKYR